MRAAPNVTRKRMTMPFRITAGCRTDRGCVRNNNEDAAFANPASGVFIIADGMGGHAGGEIASSIALSTIAGYLEGSGCVLYRRARTTIRAFCEGADAARQNIARYGEQHPELQGMDTTVVAAVCVSRQVLIAHLGDSRAYAVRAGHLIPLTHDHTLVARMVQEHEITPEDARRHHLRHVVTSSVVNPGGEGPSFRLIPWRAGDCLLLCSDGLTSMVPDAEIERMMIAPSREPQSICDRLVERAIAYGGKDNVSVIVAGREA